MGAAGDELTDAAPPPEDRAPWHAEVAPRIDEPQRPEEQDIAGEQDFFMRAVAALGREVRALQELHDLSGVRLPLREMREDDDIARRLARCDPNTREAALLRVIFDAENERKYAEQRSSAEGEQSTRELDAAERAVEAAICCEAEVLRELRHAPTLPLSQRQMRGRKMRAAIRRELRLIEARRNDAPEGQEAKLLRSVLAAGRERKRAEQHVRALDDQLAGPRHVSGTSSPVPHVMVPSAPARCGRRRSAARRRGAGRPARRAGARGDPHLGDDPEGERPPRVLVTRRPEGGRRLAAGLRQ